MFDYEIKLTLSKSKLIDTLFTICNCISNIVNNLLLIMTKFYYVFGLSLILTACGFQSSKSSEKPTRPNTVYSSLGPQDFNQSWLFIEEDKAQFSKLNLDVSAWQSVNLPHDWSVSHEFEEKWDGATAYLPGGVGWYRKHFVTPASKNDSVILVNFDGIYNHSTVYINDKRVGGEVNGYTPFTVDVTSFLNPVGDENVLAVRVDRTRYIDSRWYPGSGIYRNVTFYNKPKLHIPVWGTQVTTENISHDSGDARIKVTLKNEDDQPKKTMLKSVVVNNEGEVVAKQIDEVTVMSNSSLEVEQVLNVSTMKLWDMNSPYLYKVVSTLSDGQDTKDQVVTPLGFRTIEFKPDGGFFLNGKHTLIKGVNLHHDGGLVGAAVPEDVWRRRLVRLKEAGVNAIRMSHNPASKTLMDLCDELGFLVQAEIFDEWDYPKDKRLNQQERHDDYISRGYADWFQSHAHKDLNAAVLRDRNHPSLIMWSIGNEIEWTYPRYAASTGYFDMNANGNYFYTLPPISSQEIKQRFESGEKGTYTLADTAKKLSSWVKELDTTRPVIANLILPSVSHISGYTDALDIVGYSYRRVIYDYGRRLFPEKMIMGTENVPQWHEWKGVLDTPAIAGTFLWTGVDYMGEAHGGWPRKGVNSGLLDLAGFKKPSFHMFKTLWSDAPHMYLTTQLLEDSLYELDDNGNVVERKKDGWKTRVWEWHDVEHHWNYNENENTVVEAYSNCEAVELFVNEVSYGRQLLKEHDDRIFKWFVPFQSGEIRAEGDCGASDSIKTVGMPTSVFMSIDKSIVKLQKREVVHVEMQLVDSMGRPVRFTDANISLDIPEGIKLLGIDNGWVNSVQPFQSNSVDTYKGRALAILEGIEPGNYTITARLHNDAESKATVQVQQ
ncbi:glycoside hydrolase family 2 protein [Alteromonas sp. KUL17]|nr:glycoside hydrolase family 2 protein [Alteromonas sp. KUL17]